MTITYDTPVRLGPSAWRVFWSSDLDNPTFRVYVDGRLAGETPATWWTVYAPAGTFPVIEVLDDPDADPVSVHPPDVALHWQAVEGAVEYRVEQYVGEAWGEQAVIEEAGESWFSWRSKPLADDPVHQMRVVAVGADGNESTATERSVLMVRHPDPPDVAFAYASETGKVTLTEG